MKKIIAILILAVIGLTSVKAQQNLRTKHFNLEHGVAIQGYDPMAYFIQKKALVGNKNISTSVDGVTYYFSSQKNKDLFLLNPKQFEPQYGGWCAYAMGAVNEKVEIDPETFKVRNGKLYLFYHSWTNNTLTKWNADEANLKSKADKNWMLIYN